MNECICKLFYSGWIKTKLIISKAVDKANNCSQQQFRSSQWKTKCIQTDFTWNVFLTSWTWFRCTSLCDLVKLWLFPRNSMPSKLLCHHPCKDITWNVGCVFCFFMNQKVVCSTLERPPSWTTGNGARSVIWRFEASYVIRNVLSYTVDLNMSLHRQTYTGELSTIVYLFCKQQFHSCQRSR